MYVARLLLIIKARSITLTWIKKEQMKQEKFNRILGAASIAVILGLASTTAAAAASSCLATGPNADGISLDDVTYNSQNATSCYGVVTDNINEQSAPAINVLGWGSDWMYLDGTDSISGTAYQGISFTVTATAGTEGIWRLTATDTNGNDPLNLPATFDLAVALKGANKYALWYYDNVPVNLSNDGHWEIEFRNKGGQNPDLSHMVIFGREGYNTPTVHTPVPAAAWLLGSGLIGLAGFGRRRVSTKAA